MWLREDLRGRGWDAQRLADVEGQAPTLGCTCANLSTWEFQARLLYERQGGAVYAAEHDDPPGHTNSLIAKGLETVAARP